MNLIEEIKAQAKESPKTYIWIVASLVVVFGAAIAYQVTGNYWWAIPLIVGVISLIVEVVVIWSGVVM